MGNGVIQAVNEGLKEPLPSNNGGGCAMLPDRV